MNIKNNLNNLRQNLSPACKLIAVSKTKPVEKIMEAYQEGHRVFGENKVQELVPKYEALPKDIEWHMIGHLQSNKVKHISSFISMIHSVDSVKLLEEINKQGQRSNRTISCLLQVHIAEEESKFGFSGDEVIQFIQADGPALLNNVKVCGLMGMATLTENDEQIRREFQGLKKLFDKLKSVALPNGVEMKELSIGMSGDYKIAMEEGSTMIRVGSAIFGGR